MGTRRRGKKRDNLTYKAATLSLKRAELGWYGKEGGRAVEVIFRDGAGAKLGTLSISAARIRWWGVHDKKETKVWSRQLDELFEMWRSR